MSQLVNAKDYISRQSIMYFSRCNRLRNVEKLARFSLVCDMFIKRF